MIRRKETQQISVGPLVIGGDAPISVQSMTNTPTKDVEATLGQIERLQEAGCDLVRLAVPDQEAAKSFGLIRKRSPLPLAADIHFDYRLALAALDQGADKIRINPGNIGSKQRLRAVLKEAAARGVPIRIGVNGGSLEKGLLRKHGGVTATALVESALAHLDYCREAGFTDTVVSIKYSRVPMMIEANRLLAGKTDRPLHLGVTEAGSVKSGLIPSAVGIGTLLAEGIGDTIRVSLTGDPVEEVKAARRILQSLGLRREGITVISCPTCARTHTDLVHIVEEVEKALEGVLRSGVVAIMGCEVNGPGEAREADIGIACGPRQALLFRQGRGEGKVPFDRIVEVILREVERLPPTALQAGEEPHE